MPNGIFYRLPVQHIGFDAGFFALKYILGFIVPLCAGGLSANLWAKMPIRTPPPPVFQSFFRNHKS